jgi:hypothetical protein
MSYKSPSANSTREGIIRLTNDIGGSAFSPTVTGIRNRPVSTTTPQDGYTLIWSQLDGYWDAKSISAIVPDATNSTNGVIRLTNDLGGTASSPTVVGLYNNPVASTTPVNSAVLVWDNTIYSVRQLTGDDILPAFTITSFSGGSTVECGATVTNPSFTAAYSTAATSAQITNTAAIDSPKVLNSPYTSGTVTGGFTSNTVNSAITFTLTANKALNVTITKTATTAINFRARSFGGVGTAGGTSATASGTTAVLVGATGTLNSVALLASDVGQTYGPFSPSNQKIYLLLPHTATAHTFKDQNGFTFVMNAPTVFNFTNQNGAVISMDLYESTNLLSTNFSITVVT